jgi:hypothetical protein
MTTTEKQMLALLECKRQLEVNYDGPVDEPTAWMIEAVALLLRHQLEQLKLRNAGILR